MCQQLLMVQVILLGLETLGQAILSFLSFWQPWGPKGPAVAVPVASSSRKALVLIFLDIKSFFVPLVLI
jgi:hypothetical protein